MTDRFSRTEQLIGKESLAGLKRARVTVFGLGAVGNEAPSFPQGRNRRPIGSLSYITGIFGLLATYEVIKMILNKA